MGKIVCKTKWWGNSLGIVIPQEEVRNLNLKAEQKIVVEIKSVENPLKELFGFGKEKKITRKEFLETRSLIEGNLE